MHIKFEKSLFHLASNYSKLLGSRGIEHLRTISFKWKIKQKQ